MLDIDNEYVFSFNTEQQDEIIGQMDSFILVHRGFEVLIHGNGLLVPADDLLHFPVEIPCQYLVLLADLAQFLSQDICDIVTKHLEAS
ncbi:MAG: hypothetical protein ACQESC_04750 [Nanobdellota archaeon]